jgi:tetratricopeptide (TPR) repeat protein
VAYYKAATDAACRVVFSGWRPLAGTETGFDGPLPRWDTEEAALAWFDRERPALIRMVPRAVAAELPMQAIALGRNTVFYLNLRGLFEDYHHVARDALAGARLLNDPALLELCLSNLAVASWKLGLLEEGVTLAREGLAAAAETGDLAAEAGCRGSLGLLLTTLGRRAEALPHVERSIELNQASGHLREAAESWTVLSSLNENRGRTDDAVAAAREAARIGRESGSVDVEIAALADEAAAWLNRDGALWPGGDSEAGEPEKAGAAGSLTAGSLTAGSLADGGAAGRTRAAGSNTDGPSAKDTGNVATKDPAAIPPVPSAHDLAAAARCLDRATELADESRLPANIALVLAYTGLVRQLQGHPDAAADLADRAQQLVEAGGSPVRQAAVANIIGRLRYHAGQYRAALEAFETAHRKASAIGFRVEAARALAGVARCRAALEDGG